MYYDTATGLYKGPVTTTWADFEATHPKITYLKRTTLKRQETTAALTQSFCWGAAQDLTISDLRLGNTLVTDFKYVTLTTGQQQSDRCVLGLDNARPNEHVPGSTWHQVVTTVEGGQLLNTTATIDQGWVLRSFEGDDCVKVGINVEGRLYYSGGSGIEARDVTFEIQHRTAGGAWTTLPQLTLSNGDSRAVRETVYLTPAAGKVVDVRIRQVTATPTDARHTCDFSATVVSFYRTEPKDASPWSKDAGKFLSGMWIAASSQLQGSIQNLNAEVQSKAWAWTGAGTPILPVGGSGWSWQLSDNPADAWLDLVRGRYLNTAAEAGTPYNGKGWTCGVDNGNGPRIYGCGQTDEKIDFEAYAAWRSFCVANNLKFNGVFVEQQTALALLDQVARIGRGSTNYTTSGLLSVVWEDPNQVPVSVFNETNVLRDSVTISYSTADIPSVVVVEHLDPAKQWNKFESRADILGNTIALMESKMDLSYGITSPAQSQREANIEAQRSNLQRRTITFATTRQGLLINRFDVVNFSHDLIGNGIAARFYESNVLTVDAEDGAYTAWITRPDGSFYTTAANVSGGNVTLTQSPDVWSDSDAVPEDWKVALVKPTSRMLRLRVIGLDYGDSSSISLTCVDDDPRLFSTEVEYNGTPIDPLAPPGGYVAEAHSAWLDKGDDKPTLRWQLTNAVRSRLSITRNGQAGVLELHGDMLSISATGKYTVTIEPVPAMPSTVVVPTFLEFEL